MIEVKRVPSQQEVLERPPAYLVSSTLSSISGGTRSPYRMLTPPSAGLIGVSRGKYLLLRVHPKRVLGINATENLCCSKKEVRLSG